MNWLISANSSIYDHASSFEHNGSIDWRQGKAHFDVGDIVYIYCTRPLMTIRYMCEIKEINIPFNRIIDDKEYWHDLAEYYKSKDGLFMKLLLVNQVDNNALDLNRLIDNGLKAAPQGPKKLNGELLKYIELNFNESNLSYIYPDMINDESDIYEGIRKQIYVNKYERSTIARRKCIEFHGLKCAICGFDFEKKYGIIGRDFIHVHHIVPINEIGKEYKIDYKKDLIPVCPNCHAMLHRLIDGKEAGIEYVKNIINK